MEDRPRPYERQDAGSSVAARTEKPVPTPAPPSAAPARTIAVADFRATEVPAQSYIRYSFQLPSAVCTVTGRIVGISGGNKDFEASIMDDDNLRNWKANLSARVYWQSERVTVTSIKTQLAGPGTFHLVIGNTFSLTTPKTVQVWAEARC